MGLVVRAVESAQAKTKLLFASLLRHTRRLDGRDHKKL